MEKMIATTRSISSPVFGEDSGNISRAVPHRCVEELGESFSYIRYQSRTLTELDSYTALTSRYLTIA